MAAWYLSVMYLAFWRSELLTSLDAALLTEGLEGLGTALDGAGSDLTGLEGVGAASQGASSLVGEVVAGGNLTLHVGSGVALTRVGNGRADSAGSGGRGSELGEVNHFDDCKDRIASKSKERLELRE